MNQKRLLVVIDVQNDFVTGSLGSKEAQAIIPKIIEKLDQAHKDDQIVMLTRDTHDNSYLESMEGKYLPVIHCVEGTPGHDFADEIRDHVNDDDLWIDKPTFGVPVEILTDTLEDYDLNMPEYELCGLCTDICVMANAVLFKTIYPKSRVIVDASACAGTTPEKHAAALEVMKSLQVEVINEPPAYVGKRIRNQ